MNDKYRTILVLVATTLMGASHPQEITAGNNRDLMQDYWRTFRKYVAEASPGRQLGRGSIYDRMQGDQPDLGNNVTGTVEDYIRATQNRDKEKRLQEIQKDILVFMGRLNSSASQSQFSSSTITSARTACDQIPVTIKSFYPPCDVPPNVKQEWNARPRDDKTMNLYFDYNHTAAAFDGVAMATLRLYRNPGNVSQSESENDEDERLMRVSIYFHEKTKRGGGGGVAVLRTKLSDSRMISNGDRWVELSVKPAIGSWSGRKGRSNLGLMVMVEDQEGNVVRAERLFKGTQCASGSSTPKPIPTIVSDFSQYLRGGPSNLTTQSGTIDLPMFPSLDICTVNSHHVAQQQPHDCDPSQLVRQCTTRTQSLSGENLLRHLNSNNNDNNNRHNNNNEIASLLQGRPKNTRHAHAWRHRAAGGGGGGGAAILDPRSQMLNKRMVATREELSSDSVSTRQR